jgi:aminoglycoside phosphotransferase (APT) family kinase protein
MPIHREAGVEMTLGRRLGAGRVAEVFEWGADVVKLYAAGIGPEQAQHEATVLDGLRGGALIVPRSLGVVEVDGRWGLKMTRMPGRPLAEQMEGNGLAAGVAQFAALHRQMHQQSVAGLMPLKQRLATRIGRVRELDDATRDQLLDRLARLPDGDRLCHGDFHPFNIMADGDNLAIIDWLDATSGPPEADVCRSYLLMLHHVPDLAELYLHACTAGAEIGSAEILDWLPVQAAARLDEGVPDEVERLLAVARH